MKKYVLPIVSLYRVGGGAVPPPFPPLFFSLKDFVPNTKLPPLPPHPLAGSPSSSRLHPMHCSRLNGLMGQICLNGLVLSAFTTLSVLLAPTAIYWRRKGQRAATMVNVVGDRD